MDWPDAVPSIRLESDRRPDGSRSPQSASAIGRRSHTGTRPDRSSEESAPSTILYLVQQRDDRRDLLYLRDTHRLKDERIAKAFRGLAEPLTALVKKLV